MTATGGRANNHPPSSAAARRRGPRAGYSIYFTSLDGMVRNLKTAEAAGRLDQPTWYLPAAERAEANLVFHVISKRYEKGRAP